MNTIRVPNSLDPDQARHIVGLILVQTVCKVYQQMTLVVKSYAHVHIIQINQKKFNARCMLYKNVVK